MRLSVAVARELVARGVLAVLRSTAQICVVYTLLAGVCGFWDVLLRLVLCIAIPWWWSLRGWNCEC